MNSTDKAMELADEYADAYYHDACGHFPEGASSVRRKELFAHIEALQKDCRTCAWVRHGDLGEFCGLMHNNSIDDCLNHNQWQAMEFKQLTRSE